MIRRNAAAGVAIVLVGMIAGAMAHPPPEIVSNGLTTAVLLVLGLAAVGARTLRGSDRAAWAGFAIFGWGYLVMVAGPWFESHVRPLLITETAFNASQARFGPYPVTQPGVPTLGESLRYAPHQIGHALTAILLGMLGAAIAGRSARSASGGRAASPVGEGPGGDGPTSGSPGV